MLIFILIFKLTLSIELTTDFDQNFSENENVLKFTASNVMRLLTAKYEMRLDLLNAIEWHIIDFW